MTWGQIPARVWQKCNEGSQAKARTTLMPSTTPKCCSFNHASSLYTRRSPGYSMATSFACPMLRSSCLQTTVPLQPALN